MISCIRRPTEPMPAGQGSSPFFLGGTAPESTRVQIIHELAKANQEAGVLGWVGVIVTGILLAMVLLGWWRLVAPGRTERQLSVSLGVES